MLTLEVLNAACEAASASRDWLTILVERLERTREELLEASAQLAGYPVLNISGEWPIKPTFEKVSYTDMVERFLIVGADSDGRLCAVVGKPLDNMLGMWLGQRALPLHAIYFADPQVIREKLEYHESAFSAVAEAVGLEQANELEQEVGTELTLTSIQGETSPAVRLINSTVFDALRFEASDIHLETLPQGLVIKFRIDGVLNQIAVLHNPALAEQAIARIKVLAELDIAEKRIPQDGRFRVAAKGRDIDIRVSIMPTIHGEDAVLRILDKQTLIDTMQRLTLDSLGFDAQTIRNRSPCSAPPPI